MLSSRSVGLPLINFLERAVPHLFPLPLLFAFLSRLKILAGNEPALTQFFSVNPQNITLVHQLSWFLNSNLTLQLLNVILIIKRTSPRWFPMSHCKDPCVTAFCPVIGVSENPCLHYDCTLFIIIVLQNTFWNDKKQNETLFWLPHIGLVTQQNPTDIISSWRE